MIPATEYFKNASRWDRLSGWLFWVIAGLSCILLLHIPVLESAAETLLVVATITAVALSAITQHLQNRGNQAQRATQLSDAFGVAIGDPAASGYYNTVVPPSVHRLALTTFENTFFTGAILCKMLQRHRVMFAAYLMIWLTLVVCRSVSLSLIVVLTQTIFSADVALRWWRMERFCSRTGRVRHQLNQLFAQGSRATKSHGFAIPLSAFSDYECAKEEAAIPLDGKFFEKENPRLSKEWEEVKARLRIG